jgi:hypothetical protein
MDPRLLIGHAVKVVLVAVLFGLYARGRSGRCLTIVAYLWAALLGNSLTTLWPDVFFNYEFWMRRQALFDVLKLLVGVEIALRAFRVFPGARATWERLLAASVVVATTAAFWFLPREAPYGVVFAHQPQTIAATVWLFTVTSLVIVHYRIPVDPWHRAILLALVPYQLAFTTSIAVMRNLGASLHPAMGLLDSTAYLVMVAYWAQTAWRHEAALDLSPAARRTLQLEGA